MHSASEVINVDATPEQVWQVLSDLRRLPEWYVPAQRIQILTEGPVRAGWQFDLAVKTLPGIVLSAIGTVREVDPRQRRIVWRGKALGIEGDSCWEVVPAPGNGGAQIRHTFQGQGWLLFLSHSLGRNALTVRQRLANLKALVEGEAQPD